MVQKVTKRKVISLLEVFLVSITVVLFKGLFDNFYLCIYFKFIVPAYLLLPHYP